MRSTFTGRFLKRWFITAAAAIVVACVVMIVSPVQQPITLGVSIAVSSCLISAWMEWVRTRQAARQIRHERSRGYDG